VLLRPQNSGGTPLPNRYRRHRKSMEPAQQFKNFVLLEMRCIVQRIHARNVSKPPQ
jgi:hypothetical protein